MKIILKYGMVIEDKSHDVSRWKAVLKDPAMIVTYSTDNYGLILFRSSEIGSIHFSEEDIEESVINGS
jgi:hypothetical protein